MLRGLFCRWLCMAPLGQRNHSCGIAVATFDGNVFAGWAPCRATCGGAGLAGTCYGYDAEQLLFTVFTARGKPSIPAGLLFVANEHRLVVGGRGRCKRTATAAATVVQRFFC
ncbi:hypothetical protein AVEN_2407-1 [Araneus ventricosus]|uniref:Uncharacterized protein n=1 Tax=Araneus ventricosus TaxID=182803 RepID=A0A4Y2P788_ARAVE|nr:hypothetical protein AVEN_2407-1 [Araneus ventricosus]